MKLGIFVLMMIAGTMTSGIEGVWTYKAPTAPYGYQEGEIHISQSDAGYTAEMMIGGYKIAAKDVKVKDNTMTCSVNVEGMSVPLSFTFDGEVFSGKADTPEGYVMIKGEKKEE